MVSKVVCSVCGNDAISFIVDKWYCQTHSIPIMEQILYQTTDAMKSFAGNKTGGAQFNPTPKSERIPEFRETLRIMEAIHEKKNKDYSSESNPFSNFEFSAYIAKHFTGVNVSFANLIGTKLARLAELLQEGRIPNNESVEDTFIDLAVYAVLWKCYFHRQNRVNKSLGASYSNQGDAKCSGNASPSQL